MSQYWGPPNYPPPRPPQYQPPGTALEVYYEPQDNQDSQKWLFFLAGSCLTLVLVACCFATLVLAWVIDARFGLTTSQPTPAAFAPSTPPANGQAPADPFALPTPSPIPSPTPQATGMLFGLGQPIIANDVQTELIVLDIQRNVQPVNVAAGETVEFVAVSVQLRSVAPTDFSKAYAPADFQLQNVAGALFQPHQQADNGRRLGPGELAEQAVVEGDLLFQIPQGESPLFLVWQAQGSGQVNLVALQ